MPEVDEVARNTSLSFLRINVPHDPVPDFIAKARKGEGNIATLILAINKMIGRDPAGNVQDVASQWTKYGVPGGEDELILAYYAAVEENEAAARATVTNARKIYPGM